VPAGEPWIHEIKRGQHFASSTSKETSRDTLFFNARRYEDRYSAQDTIRAQQNIYLTTGTKLIVVTGKRPPDDCRGHLRPARRLRRLCDGKQHGPVRYR